MVEWKRLPRAGVVVLAGLVAAVACSCNPSVNLGGHVRLTAWSDASGIAVTGLEHRDSLTFVATTGTDGSYAFVDALPGNSYTISAEAPSTLEHTVSVEVTTNDEDAATVPDIVFTPVGTIEGTASLQGQSTGNAGIVVGIAGLSTTSITDDAGKYALANIPVGTYTVAATYAGHSPGTATGVAVGYDRVTTAPGIVMR